MSKVILLVEDEGIIAMSEAQIIRKHGYEVRTAADGKKAVEEVDTTPDISLVLMDIDLGEGIDGTETASRILEKRQLPIVFLTSHAEREIVDRVKGITRYGYVLKNSGEFVLIEAIQMAYELFEAHTKQKEEAEEREKSEQRLLESEALYRQLMENSFDAIYLLDDKGNIINVNEAACGITGFSKEELLSFSIEDIDPHYTREAFSSFRERRSPGDTLFIETEHRHKSGANVSVELNGFFVETGGEKYLFAIAHDLTKRKRTEEKFHSYVENSLDGLIVTDMSGKIVEVNPALSHITGYSQEELLKMNITDFFTSEKREFAHEKFSELFSTGTLTEEFPFVKKDGAVGYWSVSAGKLSDNRLLSFAKDVTDRKEKELELEEESVFKQQIIDNAHEGIIVWNKNLRYTLWNSFMETMTGKSREEVLGRKPEEVFPALMKSISMEGIRAAVSRGESSTTEFSFEIEETGKEGWVSELNAPLINHAGERVGVIGFVRDITERKKMEKRLYSAIEEKEDLMKELNHRVKNNLTMISSLIKLKDSETVNDLSDISHQIDAIRIVHEMLYKSETTTSIDVHKYTGDLLETIFSYFTAQPVYIENEIKPISIPTKTAIPIGLIINEIATNAIKHGFTETEEARFRAKMHTDEENGLCILELSNTGAPFPEDVEIERSTSLGLNLISTLVGQLNGSLELNKNPNPVFTINFPKPQFGQDNWI